LALLIGTITHVVATEADVGADQSAARGRPGLRIRRVGSGGLATPVSGDEERGGEHDQVSHE
jgi:hypothetical protein